MDLGRLGIWYSVDRLDGTQLQALLKTVETHGYASFWYPESRGYESMSLGAFLLAQAFNVVWTLALAWLIFGGILFGSPIL